MIDVKCYVVTEQSFVESPCKSLVGTILPTRVHKKDILDQRVRR